MKFILSKVNEDKFYLMPYEFMKLICLDSIYSEKFKGILDFTHQDGEDWAKAIKYAGRGNQDKALKVINAFEESEVERCDRCELEYDVDKIVHIKFEASAGIFAYLKVKSIQNTKNIADKSKEFIRFRDKLALAGLDTNGIVLLDNEIYCVEKYINSPKINRALRCKIDGIDIDKDTFYCNNCSFLNINSMKIKVFEGCMGIRINGCNAWFNQVYLMQIFQIAKSTVYIQEARKLTLYYLHDSILNMTRFSGVKISKIGNSRININNYVKYGDIGLSDEDDKYELSFESMINSKICFYQGCDRYTLEKLVGMLKKFDSVSYIGVPSGMYEKYKNFERYSNILIDLSKEG